MKSPLLLTVAVLGILLVATSSRILQFHYPRAIENDPLLSPLKVQSVSGNTLVLEDGRKFDVAAYDAPLEEIVKKSGFYVDVENDGSDSAVMIYAKPRGWICGTPWAALINIPLIADDVPINRRKLTGFATLVQAE